MAQQNNTKEKLIETARELIWRASYNAVSVDDICRKADVKKGSFYHFFPSKADLAIETIDAGMKEIRAHYDEIFTAERPPAERFSMLVTHLVNYQKDIAKQYGHVCGCPMATLGSELATQDRNIEKKIIEIYDLKARYYEQTLRELAAAGDIPEVTNFQIKAEEIFALITGHMTIARIKNDLGFAEQNLEKALFDLIGIKDADKAPVKLAG